MHSWRFFPWRLRVLAFTSCGSTGLPNRTPCTQSHHKPAGGGQFKRLLIRMSTPRPQTLELVKTLLRRDLKLAADAPIADDMPFFGGDMDLDSLDILLLMTSIEKQFKIKVPSETIGKQVFQNVTTLATYI